MIAFVQLVYYCTNEKIKSGKLYYMNIPIDANLIIIMITNCLDLTYHI